MTVAIIDYGSGNLKSAAKAVERAASDNSINTPVLVTADPAVVRAAARVILPGVGAFADCRAGLDAVPGMVEALTDAVKGHGVPFLGICVGMQLMASRGLEKTITHGLDWIGGDVGLIEPKDPACKIPHMGWNTLTVHRPHPLLAGLATGDDGLHAYFVHSYHLVCADPADVVATTDYAGPVTAMVGRDNIVGTQFHPEKSQALGLGLIANFLRWRP